MSISTGTTGDEKTNPQFAYKVGVGTLSNSGRNSFAKVKFQRKRRFKPLGVAMTRVTTKEFSYSVDT